MLAAEHGVGFTVPAWSVLCPSSLLGKLLLRPVRLEGAELQRYLWMGTLLASKMGSIGAVLVPTGVSML